MPITADSSYAWDLSPDAAKEWQRELCERLILEDDFASPPRLVGGVDSSYTAERAYAVIVVLTYPKLDIVTQSVASLPVPFPYVPGLLSMREGPAIEEAWAKLPNDHRPDLLMFDGHGIAHMRRLGIASHMGLLLDRPSIGIAKRILVGEHDPVPDTRGAWQPLIYRGETIGAALRTREGVKPVFVSPGHRISLETAIRYVLETGHGYKLPKPTHLADRRSREVKS